MTTAATILAPVDFSSGSKTAVEYAAALAKALRSTITLFHVYHKSDLMSGIVPGADPWADDKTNQAIARTELEKMRVETERSSGVEVRAIVVSGSPAEQIVSYASRGAFDLVVMGTHGRTGIQRFLMGSVAETVVRHARCPILTIHLPPTDHGS
jgi:nucleotide-binding universal stress UspA family protein